MRQQVGFFSFHYYHILYYIPGQSHHTTTKETYFGLCDTTFKLRSVVFVYVLLEAVTVGASDKDSIKELIELATTVAEGGFFFLFVIIIYHIIYQVEVTTPTTKETYIRLCDTTFKLRSVVIVYVLLEMSGTDTLLM